MIFGVAAVVALWWVAISGLPVPAASMALAALVVDAVLLASRRSRLKEVPHLAASRPPGDARPIGANLLLFAATAGVLLAVGAPNLGDAEWPVRGLAVTGATVLAVIHMSSLVDWAIINPHFSGVMGSWRMPCQRADWTFLTRLWLAHRLLANVVVRVGIVALVGFGVAHAVTAGTHDTVPSTHASRTATSPTVTSASPTPTTGIATPASTTSTTPTTTASSAPQGSTSPVATTPAAGAQAVRGPQLNPSARSREQKDDTESNTLDLASKLLGSILAVVLLAYLNVFRSAWSLVLNPRVNVGDRIILAEEFGAGVEARPVYYVVDIAVEGIKLLELNGTYPTNPTSDGPDRPHDRSLDLSDLPKLLRFRGQFGGCSSTCCKANHACRVGLGNTVDTQSAPADNRSTETPGAPAPQQAST